MINNRLRTIVWALASLLLVSAFLACTPEHPQSTFDSHGPVAEAQMGLFNLLTWIVSVVFVLVTGGLLYTVFKFRARPGAPPPQDIHGNTKLEIAWTVIPVILLAAVAVPTVQNQFYIAAPPEGEDKLVVNVVAHQWWWEFDYPDLGLSTANEFHVPVGTNIEFNMTSEDVLHSFWVPKLAGKMDIIPGKNTTMWFKADTTDADPSTPEKDSFYGQCAEFCGVAHSWMRFRVHVDEQDEFDAWVEHEKSNAKDPETDLEKEGYQLFLTKGCVACHAIQGRPDAVALRGPNLTHFGNRSTLAAGIKENNNENLKVWLKNPDDLKGGTIMANEAAVYINPDLALSNSDLDALVAYLRGLK